MEYAIILCFDEGTEAKIQRIINTVAEKSGNRCMIDREIPPHVTIGAFAGIDEQAAVKTAEECLSYITPHRIWFERVKGFSPKVVFIVPQKDEFLKADNKTVHQIFAAKATAGDNGNYMPEAWVPHITLSSTKNIFTFYATRKLARKLFQTFDGYAKYLAIAQVNPYKELKRWMLKEV